MEARLLLEVPAARLAARRRTEAAVEQLRADIPGKPLALGTREQFVHNRDFHAAVLEAAGNMLLVIAARPVFDVLQTHLARSKLGARFHRAINDHHRSIVAAIEVQGRGRRRGGDARPRRVSAPVLREGVARRAQARVTVVRFGIQGSGQLVGELPPPALFLEVARARRGARVRLAVGRRSRLVREPHSRRHRGACHLRGSHEPDHDRCRHRPAPVAPARARRQGVRLARLRLAADAWCSASAWAARAPRTSRPSVSRSTSVERVRTRRCWCCVSCSPTRRRASRAASPASPGVSIEPRPRTAGRATALGRRALARSAAPRGPARGRLVADLDLARALRRRLE